MKKNSNRNSNSKPFDNKKGNFSRSRKTDPRKGFEEKGRGADIGQSAYKCAPNDWRWYAQNEQLLKDTASYPYTYPLGNQIDLGQYGALANQESIPGIMRINIAPAIGWSDQLNSPVNVAARNIYTNLRQANSGSVNYDAADYMIYLIAMDSCYSYLEWMKRVYGVVQTYSYTNRYYPKALVQAMGVDFQDIQKNLADFRAFINNYAVKVGAMCIPATMSYMAKHMWMYKHVFVDSIQDKAQTYIFNPVGFYVFSLDPTTKAGRLDLLNPFVFHNSSVPIAGGLPGDQGLPDGMTLQRIRDYGNCLLDPILGNQDFNTMSGDTLKAFGGSMIFKTEGITETYTVMPVYDQMALDQIQNCTLLGNLVTMVPKEGAYFGEMQAIGEAEPNSFATYYTWSITQNPENGVINFTPRAARLRTGLALTYETETTNAGRNAIACDKYITFDHSGVTPAETMEASRMCNIGRNFEWTETIPDQIYLPIWNGGTGKYEVISTDTDWDLFEIPTIASEAAISADIFHFTKMANGMWDIAYTTGSISNNFYLSYNSSAQASTQVVAPSECVTTMLQIIHFVSLMSQFGRHPAVALTASMVDTGTSELTLGKFNGFVQNINYYTIVRAEDLEEMANTALLSMFDVHSYGHAGFAN